MRRLEICILSLSSVHQDGRVLRQIEHASQDYDVTVVGWGPPPAGLPNVSMRSIERWRFPPLGRAVQATRLFGGRLLPRLWENWYWAKPDHRQALEAVLEASCDLIHVNEAIALPIAIQAAAETGAPVLYDAHEYTPLQRENRLWWRILAKPYYESLMRESAPRADAMTTVAQGIADRYREEFGLAATVVVNAPSYVEARFREAGDERIGLIHHGIATRNRDLGGLIDLIPLIDRRYDLTFMLVDREGYLPELRRRADSVAPGRVRFRDPVAPTEIAMAINAYDVSLLLIPPVTFSYAHALPNKFFESLMAGLALAIGPSPEMARLARDYRCGAVADDFSINAMASLLNGLSSPDISDMKRHSLIAARSLNAEIEMAKVLEIYDRLLSSG